MGGKVEQICLVLAKESSFSAADGKLLDDAQKSCTISCKTAPKDGCSGGGGLAYRSSI